MSFHLSDTPTLQAVATEDEQRLARDLQARVAEALAQAAELPGVIQAAESQRAAAERLDRLRSAERALNEQVRKGRERMDRLTESALDGMVETASSGGKLELKPLGELARLEHVVRFTGCAIERLTEHLIPLAHIASLREESHAMMTQARALEAIAHERAEKILGQLRDAVSEEMVLPVDLSKGVSGALLAEAAALKSRAVQLSENADQLERSYQDRNEAG